MKLRPIALLLSVGLATLSENIETLYAQNDPFSCKARIGSFVLDDSDFEAMSASGVTKATFASLAPKVRQQICDSRGVVRGIKAKKDTNCLMTTYYPNWIVTYWSKPEQDLVLNAQIDAVDKTNKCP